MDRQWLMERLKHPVQKRDVLELAHLFDHLEVSPEEVMEFSIHSNPTIAFHSAWVLESMLFANFQKLDYYLLELIDYLPWLDSDSTRRIFLKIIAKGMGRICEKQTARIFEKNFWKENHDSLEEICFRWLFDDGSKSAVKVHCLEILYLLSTRKLWIADELPGIIESKLTYSSPAIRARGQKILRRLQASTNR